MTPSFKSPIRNPERPPSPPWRSGILNKAIIIIGILNLEYRLIIVYNHTKGCNENTRLYDVMNGAIMIEKKVS